MEVYIFDLLHSLAGRSSLLDGIVVFLAKYLVCFIVAGAIFFVFGFRGAKPKIFALIVIALTAVLSRGIFTEIIRFFYDRERPFERFGFEPLFLDLNPAFPSGHTAFLFAIAIAIFYFNRFWGWWFAGFSFLVGVARIFAGVHWPSDILGGVAVALVSFLLAATLLKPYKPGLTV
ncbi:MAG: phosphatase PAP2 family protein [Candidatus Brennerbacteria bacterium]|nr:phosphatase PAP2 family protein [Candidatus Brennerbacteria bacterium]